MILKKLREKQKWSQEHLAILSGLSVRTIQRIESGHRASAESLKALASVFEVSISILEQEIVMIDKTTDEWKKLPLWFRLNFVGSEVGWLGLSQRAQWARGEKQIAVFGLVLLCLGFVMGEGMFVGGLMMLIIAYSCSLVMRAGDRYSIW